MEPLSLTHRHWRITSSETVSGDALLPLLLKRRDIDIQAQETLTAPTAMTDMLRAVERIQRAIENKECLAIFGDYDCDGVTSAAQLVRYFRRHGAEPIIRLPHRVHDGYGLNTSIVDELAAAGVTLLITVDTGIASATEVAYAAQNAMDVIITDHHHVPETLPNAYAVLHPALSPAYPMPYPCGAGVALQLVRGLEGDRWDGMEVDIALAAIGTVADVVELRGDNRRLVQTGLAQMNKMKTGPLAEFITRVRSEGTLTSTDIGFRIAPRINAAGRMADPRLALEALLSGGTALDELDRLNTERQEETRDLLEKALKQLGLDAKHPESCGPEQTFLGVASEEFGHGIIGLISGRLTEAFGRPSMVAHRSGDTCTASLRSPRCYNIAEGLGRCADLLTRFGGHAQAAGCTFPSANLESLTERLSQDVRAHTQPSDLLPYLEIDAVVDIQDVTLKVCEQLSLLEPYGQGNAEPRFLLCNVLPQQLRTVGSDNAHLQARIGGVKAIGFRLGHLLSELSQPLDLVCKLSVDTWREAQPQIVIEDMGVYRKTGATV